VIKTYHIWTKHTLFKRRGVAEALNKQLWPYVRFSHSNTPLGSLGEVSLPKLFVFNLLLSGKCCDSALSGHCCHTTWGLANIHNNAKMKIQCCFHFMSLYQMMRLLQGQGSSQNWYCSCRSLCTALLSLDRLRLLSVFLLPVLFLVSQFNSLLLWVWSMCLMDWICNTISLGQISHCTVCTKVVVTYQPAP
jgi:hypothetical protein